MKDDNIGAFYNYVSKRTITGLALEHYSITTVLLRQQPNILHPAKAELFNEYFASVGTSK